MLKFIFLMLLFLQTNAFAQNMWSQGVQQLKADALYSTKETVAIFVGNCRDEGLWHFPNSALTNSASVFVKSEEVLSALSIFARSHPGEHKVCIYLAHTHPLQTALSILKANQDKVPFKNSPPLNITNGLITMPPSRPDLFALKRLEKNLEQDLKRNSKESSSSLELTIQKLMGLVIDPSGIYTYQNLNDSDGHQALFPTIDFSFSYDEMDNEALILWTQDLEELLFKKQAWWILDLNQASPSIENLKSGDSFKELRTVYALQGNFVLLDFFKDLYKPPQ